ncbi:MAG: hypothetical protein JO047_09805, partial [Alphaproteobacteria bacterium]|nr:hypothetical protein [Alphaproteobacteria bacterium]
DLSLRDHPEIFVVGDAARMVQHGQPLPGLAAVAQRAGAYAAATIAARLAGKPAPAPFRSPSPRMLAPIGGAFAIGRFGPLQLWGGVGWLAWAALHLPAMIGVRRGVAALVGHAGRPRAGAAALLAQTAQT